jgi:hypothetical protein
MDLNLLWAALAGGAALFVWGFVSWMLLPWHNAAYSAVADEDDLARAIAKNAPVSGIYGIPAPGCGKGGPPEERKATMEKAMARMKSGPLLFAVVKREGVGPMGGYFAKSILISVLAAGLAGWLLQKTGIVSTIDRALFVMLVAGVGIFTTNMLNWNWHHFPTRYTVVMIADGAIGWFLVGLAVALVLPY